MESPEGRSCTAFVHIPLLISMRSDPHAREVDREICCAVLYHMDCARMHTALYVLQTAATRPKY